jgi:site-specific recombinase XerD
VAAFLARACEVERGIRASTLGRRVAAIRYGHKLAGLAVPTDDEHVKATIRGIRRTIGTAKRKKAPATAERIISMALGTSSGLKGLRDRALLLLGFAGVFRRSELVALDCKDIEECETGLKDHDPPQQNRSGSPGCHHRHCAGFNRMPCRSCASMARGGRYYCWPAVSLGPQGGRVGGRLTDQSVANIVKAHAKRVGLDPKLFSGHSLRAGFLTSAAKRGASIFKMMDVSRHRSVDTLRGYVRDAELFKDHAGAELRPV